MPQPLYNHTNLPSQKTENPFNFIGEQRSASKEDGEFTQNRLNYYHTLKNAFDKQVIPVSPLLGRLPDPAQAEALAAVVPFHALVRSEEMTAGQMADSFGTSSGALAAYFADINPEGFDITERTEMLGTYLAEGSLTDEYPEWDMGQSELVPDRIPVRQEDLDKRETPVDVSYLGSGYNVDKLNNPSPEESQRLQSIRLHSLITADGNDDTTGNLSQLTRLASAGVHGTMGLFGQISGGLTPSTEIMRDYRMLQEPDGHLAFHTKYYRKGEPGESGEMPLIRGQDGTVNYLSEMGLGNTGLANVAGENDPQRGMGPIMAFGRPMGTRLTDAITTGEYFGDPTGTGLPFPFYGTGAGGDQAAASAALQAGGYVVPDNIPEGKEQEFYDLYKDDRAQHDKAYEYIAPAVANVDKQIEKYTGIPAPKGYPSVASTAMFNTFIDLAGRDPIALAAGASAIPRAAGARTIGESIKALAKGLGKAAGEEVSETGYYVAPLAAAATGDPFAAVRRREEVPYMPGVTTEDPNFEEEFAKRNRKFAEDRMDLGERWNKLLGK